MKDELISVVSHELRTPVATIMGYVELMLMYDLPASQRKNSWRLLRLKANV